LHQKRLAALNTKKPVAENRELKRLGGGGKEDIGGVMGQLFNVFTSVCLSLLTQSIVLGR
jgi:hypothetical protein